MQTFAFYIDDDRYSVPTLKLEILAGKHEAKERAQVLLDNSPHHVGVEVRADGTRLSAVGTLVDDARAQTTCRALPKDPGDQISNSMR